MIEVKPDDRVLMLSVPALADARGLAERLSKGILVCVVDSAEVHSVRRDLRQFENVMVTPADSGGTLPWKDEFFSVVYSPDAFEPAAEVLRVLVTGGLAYTSGGVVVKR